MPGRRWPRHPVRAVAARLPRRRARLVAVILVAVVAAGLVARDWWLTARATDRAAEREAQLLMEIERTSADLADALAAVDADRGVLRAELDVLTIRQAERAEAEGALADAEVWLAALQGQLTTARAELDAGTARLSSLQTCLAGAADALNQASVGDDLGFLATVREIEHACTAAGVDL